MSLLFMLHAFNQLFVIGISQWFSRDGRESNFAPPFSNVWRHFQFSKPWGQEYYWNLVGKAAKYPTVH